MMPLFAQQIGKKKRQSRVSVSCVREDTRSGETTLLGQSF